MQSIMRKERELFPKELTIKLGNVLPLPAIKVHGYFVINCNSSFDDLSIGVQSFLHRYSKKLPGSLKRDKLKEEPTYAWWERMQNIMRKDRAAFPLELTMELGAVLLPLPKIKVNGSTIDSNLGFDEFKSDIQLLLDECSKKITSPRMMVRENEEHASDWWDRMRYLMRIDRLEFPQKLAEELRSIVYSSSDSESELSSSSDSDEENAKSRQSLHRTTKH